MEREVCLAKSSLRHKNKNKIQTSDNIGSGLKKTKRIASAYYDSDSEESAHNHMNRRGTQISIGEKRVLTTRARKKEVVNSVVVPATVASSSSSSNSYTSYYGPLLGPSYRLLASSHIRKATTPFPLYPRSTPVSSTPSPIRYPPTICHSSSLFGKSPP
ncbi:hypothetical protein NL676_030624 [Syzygium grande]|nr:hypothetical protein NL676_030624 [Syzygium grande]